MRAYRSTPHTSTGETPNFLMLGRETRVLDHLTMGVVRLKVKVTFVRAEQWAELFRQLHDAPVTHSDQVV